MYLVSIYFDEKTNRKIQRYINQVAEKSGNTFMLDGNVPPHITVSAFEGLNEENIIEVMDEIVSQLFQGNLHWTTAGQFFPYVMYISPVLNQYLHEMSEKVYRGLQKVEGIKISPYYRPFQWLPHITIGKTLSKEEMKAAFEVMQNSFGPFEGTVVKIGLAKPNPHRDIKIWNL